MWSYDEGWVRTAVGPTLHQSYFDAGRIPAEDTDYDVWPSRVIANIYQNNMAPESALFKVNNELKKALNPPKPSGDEHGPLTAKDSMFFDEDGHYYNALALSSFHLIQLLAEKNYQQFDDVVQQAIDLGIREFRTLASFNGGLGRFIPFEYSDYNDIIGLYINLIEQAKRRSEITVFADAQNWITNLTDQNIFLGRIASLINGHVLVNGELANEYPQNGIDPSKFSRPAGANLWSAGSGLSDQVEFPTRWDYITYHEGRPDDWPRRNNCRDIRSTYKLATRCDESMGADANNIPGKRSNNPQDFYEFAANQALNSNGYVIHSTAGTTSSLLAGVELECIAAAIEGFNTVDASWLAGQYTRGGLSNCPLVHDDAHELRTFCRIKGNQSRCIVIRSDHQHRESRNSWMIEKIDGPNSEYVELEIP